MDKITLKQGLNKVLNTAENRLQRTRLASRPLVVDVVVTKACNLACTFCKDYELEGAKRVSLEQFETIAAQLFPTARWVNICSGGEPYLHKGLEDLLRLAKQHGAQRWVLSNGMLLDEGRMRSILEQGLISLHGFSVDGMRPETVEGIRTNAKLPVILDKVDMLLRLRDEVGGGKPGIVIRYALMRRNVEEVPDAVRYWGDRGVERLDLGYLSIANGIDHSESLFYHQDLMVRVFDEARRAAERYPGLKVNLPPTVAEERVKLTAPVRCKAPWEFVMIDTSGNVLPCYRAFEALSGGRIHGEGARPFEEIWNSPLYRELRRTVNDDSVEEKRYSYCGVCENRYGWGREQAHLGDEVWSSVALDDPEQASKVDHRRAGFRPLPEDDVSGATAGEREGQAAP